MNSRSSISFLVILVCLFGPVYLSEGEEAEEFTAFENEDGERLSDRWAVELDTDDDSLADKIARSYGFKNIGKIGSLPGHYEFVRDSNTARMKRSTMSRTKRLIAHPRVKWAARQRILEREKRDFVDLLQQREKEKLEEERDKRYFDDPKFPEQWYLKNHGQFGVPEGNDISVLPVWKHGYTGKGVVVSILDDGLDHTHPDLKRNYDPKASTDLNSNDPNDHDPFPNDKDPYNAHGTKCGGEVGAEGDNHVCGVGVAPNVSLGGVRMLDGTATDALEAKALSFKPQYVDIYSNCWGPKDDGKTFGRPGRLGQKALRDGAEKGRGGKGSLYVWATGNGGLVDDDCNCDGYTSSIYTISVGAVSSYGLSTYYDEQCSSTMCVTYTGDSHKGNEEEFKLITTDLHHKCTESFRGTSSAAPLASGIFALVLQANPNLTWRDLQHIVVHTAQKTSPKDDGWKLNGANNLYNHKFGFGILNATALVQAALKWKHVPEQHICHVKGKNGVKKVFERNGILKVRIWTDGCEGSKNHIKKLEHVQVTVSLQHNHRGALSIDIVSPMGTKSMLLSTRRYDQSTNGLKDWTFMTIHMWGENPKGWWEVIFKDNSDSLNRKKDTIDIEEEEKHEIDARRRKKAHRDEIPVPHGYRHKSKRQQADDLSNHYDTFRDEIRHGRFGGDYMRDEIASQDEARQLQDVLQDEENFGMYKKKSKYPGYLTSISMTLYGTDR